MVQQSELLGGTYYLHRAPEYLTFWKAFYNEINNIFISTYIKVQLLTIKVFKYHIIHITIHNS